jgi:tetratricopeptide (TPR) repeat protein
MSLVRADRRGFTGLALTMILLASVAGLTVLKSTVDRIPRQKIPGASIIYIPSGKLLKYATLGYSSLAADLIYLWAIQYYSTYTVIDRFQNLEHIFSIISELDPRYTDPYEVGALIAAYEARDLGLAFKILDLGLAKNPDQWLFPFEAGHYAQMAKDYETARRYYEKASRIPGAPEIVKRLHAATRFKTMDLKTAWEMWLEVRETAADDRTRKIADNHLYQVKSVGDIGIIRAALARFRERYGRLPAALEELERVRILPSLPRDLDGRDYLYDSHKGEVSPPSIWWKR